MRISASVAALLLAVVSHGQSTGAGGERPAGSSSPRTFEAAFGYARNFVGGDPSSIYYKLNYRGRSLAEAGKPPQLSTPGSTYLGDLAEVDGYDLKFLLNDGIGELTGPLADLVALRPLNVGGDLFRYVHGKVQTSAKLLDDQQYNVALGLETVNVFAVVPGLRSLRLPTGIATRLGTGDPAKVLRLGILGEKQSRERGAANSKTTDTLQLTYRAYFALGFSYVQPETSREERRAALARVDALSTDGLAILLQKKDATDPFYQALVFKFGLSIPATLTLEQAKEVLRAAVPVYTDQRSQPTYNLEARAEGSYAALEYDVRRYNALYTLAANVWLNPRRPDDGKLTLGYQNGYSRGALTQAQTGFIATIGFRF